MGSCPLAGLRPRTGSYGIWPGEAPACRSDASASFRRHLGVARVPSGGAGRNPRRNSTSTASTVALAAAGRTWPGREVTTWCRSKGSSRGHAGREQVAAPLLTSPHGGGRHQLGSPNRTSPAATNPRWCNSAGRWRLTRATKRSPGSSRSCSADSRAKVAWASKPGSARSPPTRISLNPKGGLVGHDGNARGAGTASAVVRACPAHRLWPPVGGAACWRPTGRATVPAAPAHPARPPAAPLGAPGGR
jgi:hypothetical protein